MCKRAVLYARVCLNDEAKLDNQLRECREHAVKHGWQIVAELAECGPAGDGTAFRLAKQDLFLQMAKAGEFDILVLRDVTRLTRSTATLLQILQSLNQLAVQIECISGGPSLDASSFGLSVEDPLVVFQSLSVYPRPVCRSKRNESKGKPVRGPLPVKMQAN